MRANGVPLCLLLLVEHPDKQEAFAQCSRAWQRPLPFQRCSPILARKNRAPSSHIHRLSNFMTTKRAQNSPAGICSDVSEPLLQLGASSHMQLEVLGTALQLHVSLSQPGHTKTRQHRVCLIMKKYLFNKEKIFRRDKVSHLLTSNSSCQDVSQVQRPPEHQSAWCSPRTLCFRALV